MIFIRTLLFSIAFVSALFVGYKAGEKLNPGGELFGGRMDAMTMPGVPIPDNNQFNLLIIGVDDMNRPDANLESIWLAAHAENSNKITLIPVFPSADDPDHNLVLDESFFIDEGKPSKNFWDAMRKTNFWWKGYLLSDKKTSIKLIDVLGGVGIHSQEMNGAQAVGSITSWRDDAWLAIYHQKMLLESICNRTAANQSPNLKNIGEILDQDFRSNTRTKIHITGWTARAASDGKLICTFPTLTQTSLKATDISPKITNSPTLP